MRKVSLNTSLTSEYAPNTSTKAGAFNSAYPGW